MDRQKKLKEFIERDPKDYFSKHALAMEFIKIGNEQEAGSLLESILTDNPGYIGSYYHLGKLYERTGEPEKAKQIYEQGIEQAKKLNDRHSLGELLAAIDIMD